MNIATFSSSCAALFLINQACGCGDAVVGSARRGTSANGALPEAAAGRDAGSGGMATGGKTNISVPSNLFGGAGGGVAAAGSPATAMIGGAMSVGGSGGAPSSSGGGLSVAAGGAVGAPAAGGSAGVLPPPDLSGITTGERGCGANGCEGTVSVGTVGTVLREYWLNVSANIDEVSAFTASALGKFPAGASGSTQLNSLQSVSWLDGAISSSWAAKFGERIRGFIKAPATGNYVFWVGGDNECQFWLSSDESPANAKLIAMIVGYSPIGNFTGEEQKSVPIALEAGKLYYLDFFHRENLGGTHAVVRWSRPGESTLTPGEVVPGSVLATAVPQ